MRSIVNISLTPQLDEIVTKAVSTGQFASKSEFIRSLLRNWAEDKLLSELKLSQQELNQNKGKLLSSLKDLR